MNSVVLNFVITFISGLSTMLGTIIIFIKNKNKNKIISYSLIFSSSIMLFISIFDLLPSSFNYFNKFYLFVPSLLLVFIYSIFGSLLIRYINNKNCSDNSLYKVGIISLFALVLHNIPEGIITFISTEKNLTLGLSLSISIALHNIPEGIAISIPIYYAEGSKKKALIYTLIAALSEPFGAVIAYLFLNRINDYLFSIILAFTAGIMIYISIFELFKESIKYYNRNLFLVFAIGIIIMLISKIII